MHACARTVDPWGGDGGPLRDTLGEPEGNLLVGVLHGVAVGKSVKEGAGMGVRTRGRGQFHYVVAALQE
jgi:hypothetical protein